MAHDLSRPFLEFLVLLMRKQAEQELGTLAVHLGFVDSLLQLVLDQGRIEGISLGSIGRECVCGEYNKEEMGSGRCSVAAMARIDGCICIG
jgi:hypothetical protein